MSDPAGAVFGALADPTRRFVVRCLAEGGPVTATELAEQLPITRQAVTKHLAALHEAGLVALTHTPSPMGFIRTLLDRPPHERPFCLIPVGYPAAGCTVPDLERKPLDEILVRC